VEWLVEGETIEELLVGQLQEIVYRLDSEGMVFSEFRIRLAAPQLSLQLSPQLSPQPSPQLLQCLAHGEPLDREKHRFKTEVKAVTYHRLFVGEEKGYWVARVIFDV
jgi:SHS2 domain-containing protein